MCLWYELVISITGCRLSRKPVVWHDVIFPQGLGNVEELLCSVEDKLCERILLFFLVKGACTWQPAGGSRWSFWHFQQIFSGTLTVCLCVIIKVHTVIISMPNSQCNGIQFKKAFKCFVHRQNTFTQSTQIMTAFWSPQFCPLDDLSSAWL